MKILVEKAVIEQALEALEQWKEHDAWHKRNDWNDEDESAITALREALSEQAEQEPVAVVEITYGREPECYVTGNIDNFPEGVFKLYAAPVDAKAIRAEALEEAAKVCEEVAKHYITNHKEQEQVWLLAATSDCAAAIRARGETK